MGGESRARLAHAQRARRPLGRRARAHPRRPARFPFVDPASGEFSVAARIERGVLHYAEAWPRIENIRGELLFERNRMHIAGRSASVLGVALANVEVGIPRLKDPSPHLEVSGEARRHGRVPALHRGKPRAPHGERPHQPDERERLRAARLKARSPPQGPAEDARGRRVRVRRQRRRGARAAAADRGRQRAGSPSPSRR